MPYNKSLSGKLRSRKPLSIKTTKWTRFWTFLNSSIGIWLLSTIFISMGSWLFTIWMDGRKFDAKIAETIKKLDTEISSRFYYRGIDIDFLSVGITRYKNQKLEKDLDEVYSGVLNPPPKARIMYTEYSERGVLSLMEELAGLVKGQEQICVALAMKKVRETMLRIPIKDSSAENTAEALALVKIVADYRWSKDAKLGKFFFEKNVQPNLSNKEPTECPVHYFKNYRNPMDLARKTGGPFGIQP